MKRFGSAAWNGSLREGKGSVSTESHALENHPYTFFSRYGEKPSFYAVSTEDRTINPDLERFMAKRMGANAIEVKASHLSLISQPDVISQLTLEAAGQTA